MRTTQLQNGTQTFVNRRSTGRDADDLPCIPASSPRNRVRLAEPAGPTRRRERQILASIRGSFDILVSHLEADLGLRMQPETCATMLSDFLISEGWTCQALHRNNLHWMLAIHARPLPLHGCHLGQRADTNGRSVDDANASAFAGARIIHALRKARPDLSVDAAGRLSFAPLRPFPLLRLRHRPAVIDPAMRTTPAPDHARPADPSPLPATPVASTSARSKARLVPPSLETLTGGGREQDDYSDESLILRLLEPARDQDNAGRPLLVLTLQRRQRWEHALPRRPDLLAIARDFIPERWIA